MNHDINIMHTIRSMHGIRLTSSRWLLLLCVFLFTASFINLVVCSSLVCPQKNHAAMFVFGDSVYDFGNNNYINTIIRANYYPYGETYFKYPSGRFSNGRLIPDFIAEYANLPLILPYLHPRNHDQFTYGVNFASAGAGALSETYQGYVIDLKTQLSYFNKVEKQLSKELGNTEAMAFFSKAVYLFSIGANDYMAPFVSNSTVLSKQEYVGMVIGNLTETIKEIHKKGGRKFGLITMGSLGCLPYMKALVPGNTGACFEQVNQLAKLHDAALPKALEEMETKLAHFKYSIHNYSISYSERVNDPEKYGFNETSIACCGSGPFRGILNCGGRRPGVKEYELCSDPNQHLFFDSVHLSDEATKQIAQLMWNGTPDITGPYNLKALFQA